MPIKNDVFDIADRLRQIDGGYYPVYNLTRRRYEIHHAQQRPTLCVVLPYDSLDSRAIDRLYATMAVDRDEYVRRIDEHNDKLARDKQLSMMDEARYKARHLVGYLDSTKTRSVPGYDNI